MLLMKPGCENCDDDLPADRPGAVICSFECTWCEECALKLGGICPNCGGDLQPRPQRPTGLLESAPPSTDASTNPGPTCPNSRTGAVQNRRTVLDSTSSQEGADRVK